MLNMLLQYFYHANYSKTAAVGGKVKPTHHLHHFQALQGLLRALT